MKDLLADKIAVITGAGSGVGRAATLLFVEQGARVVAADVNLAGAQESARLAKAAGGEAIAIGCDVTRPEALADAVAAAVEAFGRLDIIYNNAGITVSSNPNKSIRRLIDLPDDEMRRVEDINVNGVIYGCQAAIRQFEAQGTGGAIVNTASVAGLIGYGGVLYGATKGAVVALTRTLALEVADLGIRVNSVCPAGMLTNYGHLNPDAPDAKETAQRMGRAHPLGRVIDPRDTAAAAAFLASDLALNITGVNLPVDGGLSAGRKTGA